MADENLSFMARLKRHHIFRVASVYAVAVYILIQAANAVFPDIGLSRSHVRYIIVAAALLFPMVLVLGWMFIPPSKENPEKFSRWQRLHWWLGTVLSLVIIVLVTTSGIYLWRINMRHLEAETATASNAVSNTAQLVVAPIPSNSIAVLPFINIGGHADEQYFSDGLSEDLIIALSQFNGLKVISRNSAFQFRDSKVDSKTIGEKLGVAHLLEGSVRRSGHKVRVSTELVNAADGSTLWSQRYDRPYKDLFKLQDDITSTVATALKAKLLPGGGAVVQSDRPPSGNLDAYTAYLQGIFYYSSNTEADDRKAIDYFNEAIRLDPRYAAAYAGLSNAWTSHAAQFLSGTDMSKAYAKARASANTAITLNSDLAAAHLARAYLLQTADFDWAGADSEFKHALQLAPEDSGAKFKWAVLLATLGKLDPAVQLTQEALVRDPLHAIWYGWLAEYLLPLNRLDEAEAATRKAIALQPDAVGQYELLAIIEILRGDASAALRAAQMEPPGVWGDTALALAQQISGNRAAADAALKNLINKQTDNAPYQIAEVYALRKDPDQMFAWLERAWTSRDPGISSLLYDPLLLRYKDDPRFAAFCKKVGLPVPKT